MFRVGLFDRMKGVLLVAAFALVASCGDQSPTAPVADQTADRPADLLFFSKPKLLECGPAEFASRTLEIGPLGGTISVGGASVLFPENALSAPTLVTLTIPASPYVEIDVEMNGGQDRFPIPSLRPIVSISYARCTNTLLKLLSAWYINSDTKELLERMPSIDNKLTKSVIFRAEHFSGYAIAF